MEAVSNSSTVFLIPGEHPQLSHQEHLPGADATANTANTENTPRTANNASERS